MLSNTPGERPNVGLARGTHRDIKQGHSVQRLRARGTRRLWRNHKCTRRLNLFPYDPSGDYLFTPPRGPVAHRCFDSETVKCSLYSIRFGQLDHTVRFPVRVVAF